MKRTCIKYLPNVLLTVLKRFELNYDTMTHSKLNGRFEFPTSINMKEYTVEHIEKQSVLEEMKERNISLEELEPEKREILENNYPEDYYQYELKGIVIHKGEANAGHYYSYIKDRETNDSHDWFEFNDASVTPFNIDDLDDKTFGGEEELSFSCDPQEHSNYNEDENFGEAKEHVKIEKSANAYMLVYERKRQYMWETIANKDELIRLDELGKHKEKVNIKSQQQEPPKNDEEQVDLLGIEDSSVQQESSDKIEIPKEFAELINKINMKDWQLKYVFASESIDSIYNLILNCEVIRFTRYDICKDFNLQEDLRKQPKAVEGLGISLVHNIEIIKFGIKYYFTVLLRSHNSRSKLIAPIYNFIETAIENNVIIALFMVELFTYEHLITELLMTVPLITFETSNAGLLNASLKQIYRFEHESVNRYMDSILVKNEVGQVSISQSVEQKLDEYLLQNSEVNSWQKGEFDQVQSQDIQGVELNEALGITDDLNEGEEEEEEEESESEGEDHAVQFVSEDDHNKRKEIVKNSKERVLIVQDEPEVDQSSSKLIYKYSYGTKNDYVRVPLIIRLANVLIHKMYEVEPMRSRSHNLLNVLTKIAECSIEMRTYFLVNKMVGRLLDNFYDDL